MVASTALWILFALSIKHFIVDFPLQAFPYQYKNKGTYMHPGGLLHSGLHGVGTFVALFFFVQPMAAIGLATVDAIVHYHIDWAKMNINRIAGWTPVNSEKFWTLLGLDQLLHTLTYLWIVWILV